MILTSNIDAVLLALDYITEHKDTYSLILEDRVIDLLQSIRKNIYEVNTETISQYMYIYKQNKNIDSVQLDYGIKSLDNAILSIGNLYQLIVIKDFLTKLKEEDKQELSNNQHYNAMKTCANIINDFANRNKTLFTSTEWERYIASLQYTAQQLTLNDYDNLNNTNINRAIKVISDYYGYYYSSDPNPCKTLINDLSYSIKFLNNILEKQ